MHQQPYDAPPLPKSLSRSGQRSGVSGSIRSDRSYSMALVTARPSGADHGLLVASSRDGTSCRGERATAVPIQAGPSDRLRPRHVISAKTCYLWPYQTGGTLLSSRGMATTALAANPRTQPPSPSAEAIRLAFADAWGEMGAAWGVPPSVARVHGYILAHPGPLTEREVREALGLSPSGGQPGPRRVRGVGAHRAHRRSRSGRPARAERRGLHEGRRSLGLVPAHRRAAQAA